MAMRPRSRDRRVEKARVAAGNGLLDRRVFLTGGAGALAAGAFMAFAPARRVLRAPRRLQPG